MTPLNRRHPYLSVKHHREIVTVLKAAAHRHFTHHQLSMLQSSINYIWITTQNPNISQTFQGEVSTNLSTMVRKMNGSLPYSFLRICHDACKMFARTVRNFIMPEPCLLLTRYPPEIRLLIYEYLCPDVVLAYW